MFKKLLLSIILASFLLVTLVTPYAHAQVTKGGTWYHPTINEFFAKVYDPNNEDEIFGERYTQAQVVWIWYSLIAVLMPEELLQCFTKADSADLNAIAACIKPWIDENFGTGDAGQPSLASTFNRITLSSTSSGIGYIRNTLSKLHLIPEAKAQTGFGFGTLSPIQQIWGATRNFAYFLMVLAFVVLAFMIMFRVKISPQTVITIQSAIPRLVMILIFITFSYAIAGFIIDLSYALVGILALAADPISGLDGTALFGQLLGVNLFTSMAITLLVYIIGLIMFPGGSGLTFAFGLGALLSILSVVIFIILIIVYIIVWVRIIWVLFRTFINVVLLIIFSPLLILAGVFPGSGGFGGWLKNLASQVAVFPGVIAMFFLAHYIFWSSLDANPNASLMDQLFIALNNLFPNVNIINPLEIDPLGTTGSIQLPGFNLPVGGIFGFLVAFGILMLAPSIANIIQSALSGRPFGYGTAIGAPIAAGAGAVWSPFGYQLGSLKEAYGKQRGQKLYEQLAGSRLGKILRISN
ncbi:hypothetical protein A2715_03875 [Candidatus Woesebacteria bacterium RIFCSPHIGHO2_01_FULL_39_32]|uniref:Uncharacterized protein n=1 Tax=Candidatus Woesebacteria bacterium RIFCSPLOWO2_01_FULL_39_25 TaxID=1802521 RepID=A0A1F8BIT7_9BACT|nr:MAG: hypothetical protein A2124_03050 [Candidatus Woesebacteria bacterium GWB1_37_5]OGM25052.1 MAG: hypothetical protein A2715_03875 [Candidatus Woesebacteria bacterium RIFCSPHIGHO2_01_FULL_39_32]OGM63967.1 MAG: hypothetical protein A2893_00465 [Candidatus Woesebacteria bacterium RIFCSPLOWO2_01_FULL_39_25]